jgi:hypothetical protein|tara:strand:+ start:487 stop:921 length:435 start_codon:yes stop_codon:yes gene_type:complete
MSKEYLVGYRERNREKLSAQNIAYKNKNKDRLREQNKIYAEKNKKAIKERLRRWGKTARGKETQAKHRAKYLAKYPEKAKARELVCTALKYGRLTRPSSCSECGEECKPEAHHHSYKVEDALDVTWLCRSCHVAEHKRLSSQHE